MSSGQDNQKRKSFKISQSVIALIFILGFCVVFLFLFGFCSRKVILTQLYNDLEVQTLVEQNYLDSIFTASGNNINTIATILSNEPDKQVITPQALKMYAESSDFEDVCFAYANGRLITSSGLTYPCFNLQYFEEGMRGNSGMCIISDSAEESSFVFFSPVTHNNSIYGVLIGKVPASFFDKLLNKNFSGLDSVTYICTTNGRIIASGAKNNIISSVYSLPDFKGSTRLSDAISDAITYKEMVTFKFSKAAASSCHVVSYIDEYNLVTVTSFPPSAVSARVFSVFSIIVVLEFAMMIMFLAYIGNLIYSNSRKQKALERGIREKAEIIQASSRLFKRYAVLHVSEGIYEHILLNSEKKDAFPLTGKYTDLIDFFESRYVDRSSLDKVLVSIHPSNIADAFKDGQNIIRFEYSIYDQGIKWERMNVICLQKGEDGKALNVLFAIEDITALKLEDQRKSEALEEAYRNAEAANNAKSVFLASMSHDIRTPMNAIIGMTTIAKRYSKDSEKVEDCLEKINLASNHLLGLINNVLDMNKIESGKMDLHESNFTVSELFESISALTKPQAEAKNLSLSFDRSQVSHDVVIGDFSRIQQIFVNLVGNSVKYTQAGGFVNFSVSEKPAHNPAFACYEFTISDNGIGMSEEFIKEIFTPFSRAEDSRIKNIQGAGLGMAITKNIISMMNGNIEIRSQLNNGSTFIVTLILKLGENNDLVSSEETEEIRDSFPGKHILLVEDNQLNAEIAIELLAMYDITCEHVTDGKQAVDKMASVEKGHFDLILMDIQMPVMDGYTATSAIRMLPGEYPATVPIVALSANAFEEDVIKSKHAGMNEHLAKPLEVSEMLKVFSRYL